MPDLTDDQLNQLYDAIFTRPKKGPGARAACGTPGGYNRHRHDGETPCAACRNAHNAETNRQYAASPKDPDALPPIKHGSPQGARQHWYRKVPICEPCRTAYNADQSARVKARRGARRAALR